MEILIGLGLMWLGSKLLLPAKHKEPGVYGSKGSYLARDSEGYITDKRGKVKSFTKYKDAKRASKT